MTGSASFSDSDALSLLQDTGNRRVEADDWTSTQALFDTFLDLSYCIKNVSCFHDNSLQYTPAEMGIKSHCA